MTNECALKYVNNQPSLDQAYNPTKYLNTEAVIDMASLSNRYYLNTQDDLKIDTVIELDPYDLSFLDFTTCFYYQSCGNFNINLANKSYKPILLNHQTYTTTDNKKFQCNFYNLCLKAYSKKHQISENTISSQKRIALANETFSTQSLATSSGMQSALGWDTCLNILTSTGQIIYTGDTDHEARVVFKVTYNYYSVALDVTVSLVFLYNTSIPCYKNLYNNIDTNIPCPYSKYEHNSIDEIKKELADSIASESTVQFASANSKYSKSHSQKKNDDDSICASTIRTTALLKDLYKSFNDNDEEEILDEIDEIEEDEEQGW
jgi:hypothetical protein